MGQVVEPTLSELESNQSIAQQEVDQQIQDIDSDLATVRILLRQLRKQEEELMQQRNVLRAGKVHSTLG